MNKITVVMGEYPQNCGLEKEPIEWIVLKEEKNRCLCISKCLLDTKPYHNLSENVTWKDCTLRNWLNHEFLTTAFSDEEREKILLSDVANPAQNTQDYIFLLSFDEIEEYFDDEVEDYVAYEERGAYTTDYARKQGAWFLEDDCEEKIKAVGGCAITVKNMRNQRENTLISVVLILTDILSTPRKMYLTQTAAFARRFGKRQYNGGETIQMKEMGNDEY